VPFRLEMPGLPVFSSAVSYPFHRSLLTATEASAGRDASLPIGEDPSDTDRRTGRIPGFNRTVTRLASIACALICVVLLVPGCRTQGEERSRESRSVTPLGPWQAGMSLRETFESFPRGAEQAKLTLHAENPQAWAARWRLLAKSERTIDLSYFILDQDVFGMAFLGHLLERAKQGVRIRVLLDAHGTKMSWTPRGNDSLDELADEETVEIRVFRPLVGRFLEALLTLTPSAAIASEHDKVIVVDGRESLIGGRNIAAGYFVTTEEEPQLFSDTDVTIESAQVARILTEAFLSNFDGEHSHREAGDGIDLWLHEAELRGAYRAMNAWLRDRTPRAFRDDPIEAAASRWTEELEKYPELRGLLHESKPSPVTVAETRILDSQTRFGSADDPITQGLVRLVRSAREEIVILSPYLVLSEEAVEVLRGAGERGVAITILTNSPVSSDNALSQAFFLEQWPKILARVPGLRLWVGGESTTLHSKLAVFDGTLALVGTYNLDPTSMTMNSEVTAVVWSRDFAARVKKIPLERIAEGPPAVYEYRIERDDDRAPVLDEDGTPRIAFGPRDHSEPTAWKELAAYWALLRAADRVPGFSPLF
jgi:cardiolipin synthase C